MASRRESLPLFYKRRTRGGPGITRLDPRTLAFFGSMLTLIAVAGWLYLHQAAEVATYAHEIRVLEREKETLHRDIAALRSEVAELGSLERAMLVGSARGYLMPRASDRVRRIRIELAAEPVTQTVTTTTTSGLPSAVVPPGTTVSTPGFLQDLIQQFRLWADSPVRSSDEP
ncbi:MAG: hypothetical protein ACYC4R_04855 [Anaerolineae bacterium]